MPRRPALAAIAATAAAHTLAVPALAQFGIPNSTNVRERIVGDITNAADAPAPEPGDQIGAFFNDTLVGALTLDADTFPEFSLVINGDDPNTDNVEGPNPGQSVTFRFFDASTNTEFPARTINAQGENFNYRFNGEEVPDLPIDLPGLELEPTANLGIRVDPENATGGGGTGGGGTGTGGATGTLDLDGDGKITTKDAAMVLRVVVGSSAGDATNADVNGDGVINTQDAIVILRNRDD